LIRLFTLTASFCARLRHRNLETALLFLRFRSLPDAKICSSSQKTSFNQWFLSFSSCSRMKAAHFFADLIQPAIPSFSQNNSEGKQYEKTR